MFLGHYGAAYAIKACERRIPLWLLFLAVQLVDVVWALLVLAGIEKAEITAAHRGSLPIDLIYMPYTHSLVAAVAWSALAWGVVALLRARRAWPSRAALLVGVAVFSHWVFDWLVHRPDLPLYGDAAKVGLSLWDHPLPSLALEAGLFAVGLLLYVRRTGARSLGMGMLGIGILAMQVVIFWFPVLPSTSIAAIVFLLGYLQLAFAVNMVEKKTMPRRAAAAAPGT